MKTINIYTDGACSGNQSSQNKGGWACLLELGDYKKIFTGNEANTTNNRMELKAVINAFEKIKASDYKMNIFTDSAYISNCINSRWYVKWLKDGWRNSKSPKENLDLWEELLMYVAPDLLSNYIDTKKIRTTKHALSIGISHTKFIHVPSHVSLKSSDEKLAEKYRKFLASNKLTDKEYSLQDFLHIIEQNNIVDKRAVDAAEKITQT